VAVSFATGLSDHLAGKSKLSFWEKRLKKILDAKPSARRTKILNALESSARAHLGVSAAEKIDWQSIDWQKVLDFILKLIMILAPFFL